MKKRVLLTGCGGFVGSHVLEYFLEKTDWFIICIDSFRHKGTLSRIDAVFDNHLQKVANRDDFKERVEILYHDLTVPIDQQLENRIMSRSINNKGQIVEKKLDFIFNIASDSAVERSVSDPVSCARNNFELMLNMLEFTRKVNPGVFYQISTDEVYGEAKPNESHKEWDVIMPSNVYAASKASQEALAIAYWRSYDLPIVILNIMNMIGEWQDKEKFLPKIIQMVATNKEMPVYGDSETSIGTRVYLHAKNLADALIFLTKFKPARYSQNAEQLDRYNVCGDTEINNLEMAKLIASIMGKELKYKLIPSESARKGYDKRYALDGTKMQELGWKQPISFKESVEQIVKYTLDNPHWTV